MVPPFTSRLAKVPFDLDWPYWVPDDHFDLGYHCRELALPKPGSIEQLAEQTARIYSRRLDRSRPLWELYLIHGLRRARGAGDEDASRRGRRDVRQRDPHDALRPHARASRGGAARRPRPSDGPAARRAMLIKGMAALPRWPMTIASGSSSSFPTSTSFRRSWGRPGPRRSAGRSPGRADAVSQADAKMIVRPRKRAPRGPYGGRVSPHRIFGLARSRSTTSSESRTHSA